jgi:manganese/zinc/iron transport system substrate-binding protein
LRTKSIFPCIRICIIVLWMNLISLTGFSRVTAVATTGMVGDLVRNVGGGRVEVVQLMGQGVDPHLYKASQGDVARLSQADVIFYNGFHLEGKMTDILKKIGRRGKPVVAVAESVPEEELLALSEFEGLNDPHIWFDVGLWSGTIDIVQKYLSELDPESGEYFKSNAEAYRQELSQLHNWVKEEISKIPEERRVLITAHDAFGYFGRAYNIEVRGLQGISTVSEYGLRDIRQLVDLIAKRGIKAVFVESSVPRRSIDAAVEGCRARGHEVRVGGELFSDAMGAAGTEEGTYSGMVRHNVRTIVDSLQ